MSFEMSNLLKILSEWFQFESEFSVCLFFLWAWTFLRNPKNNAVHKILKLYKTRFSHFRNIILNYLINKIIILWFWNLWTTTNGLEVVMRANISKDGFMARENTAIQMEWYMKEIFLKVNFTEKAFWSIQMEFKIT